MPRRRTETLPAAEAAAAPVQVVEPNAVLSANAFRRLFGLRPSSLAREVREGRLRVSKRCGKYYILGQWALDWLAAGELKPKGQSCGANGNGKERGEGLR
jgi:hypothetical protein